MREKQVERYLVKEAKKQGWEAFKFVSPGRRDVPDRLLVVDGGRTLFVECKAPGGKLRPGQLRLADELRQRGCDVREIDSYEAVDALIAELTR